VDDIARRGQLTAARLPALVLTLRRNREWWTTGPLLRPGARVGFKGSNLVWQHYANEGLQLQWLGTFGKANAFFNDGEQDDAFGALLDEAAPLAAQRAGGIAWEYLFPFDGGRPPWVSGLAQGTALSAYSRAYVRFGDQAFRDTAFGALGIFRTPPPAGVLDQTAAGAHYLQYSFAPQLHILNGFVQALNGIHDYSKYVDGVEGSQLYAAGDAELRAELPAFDTGGWSRYSQYRDSDLSYHKLLRDFLKGLCKRVAKDDEVAAEPFCTATDRFTADLTTPPVLTVIEPRAAPRKRHVARQSLRLDKPATVHFSVMRGGFAYTRSASLSSGRHFFPWTPPRAGDYAVHLDAIDPAGNRAAADAVTHVRP
jgi:hypothetical protein